MVTLTLSPAFKEAFDMALLGAVIMRIDLRPKFHLFMMTLV